ncbi:hypothetical protein HW260_11600 (plasmid) [Helicobacter cinaedi]|uniref:plasmid mobilization protein n=1 Tax=Helicobacter cinaedi TaxID=213 RepID=UPI0018A34177|nr:ribbon-helix-helix domain-containing protein [Helicobacter cinaedi]QOQ91979.1 hypothetical protein HW260_11600 [Helicobacter cinaedi]
MAGFKNINSFKSVELHKKADDFVNRAEGETSKTPNKKRGAPPKSEANKRTQKMTIYFTEKEIHKIQEMAEQKNMSSSEFARYKIFSYENKNFQT